MIEWLRLPADAIFILLGVIPLLIASWKTYRFVRKMPVTEGELQQVRESNCSFDGRFAPITFRRQRIIVRHDRGCRA